MWRKNNKSFQFTPYIILKYSRKVVKSMAWSTNHFQVIASAVNNYFFPPFGVSGLAWTWWHSGLSPFKNSIFFFLDVSIHEFHKQKLRKLFPFFSHSIGLTDRIIS